MRSLPRRRFLRQCSGSAAGLTAAPGFCDLFGQDVPLAEKLQVASIGVRGRGGRLMLNFAKQKDVQITHICDIDSVAARSRAAEVEKVTGHRPKIVADYRLLLDEEGIDAFTIGTPDHWHALPTIHGCQAGKDVYVEKPDGHNIEEGKAMVAAARKHSRMVQMGTQARSAPWLKEAAEYVQGGAIGKVVYGRAWETDGRRELKAIPDSQPPAGIDYDLWLGPAPRRPFNLHRFHGTWRWFFDYGAGDLGNDGVHRIDYCRMVMGIETMPRKISCFGGKLVVPDDAQEWPDHQLATYDFGGKLLTYEMRIGTNPPLLGHAEGAAVYGEDGWVLLTNSGWKAYDGKNKLVEEGNTGAGHQCEIIHVRNFIDAVRSRRRQDLNQEIYQGHVSSVLCHSANIAWRTGKGLNFDAETETFDDAEANKWLGREARKGFELPEL